MRPFRISHAGRHNQAADQVGSGRISLERYHAYARVEHVRSFDLDVARGFDILRRVQSTGYDCQQRRDNACQGREGHAIIS